MQPLGLQPLIAGWLMQVNTLQQVAEVVVSQARQRGFVLPRDIRGLLTGAGLSETLWKEVVDLARPLLRYHNGRYYHAEGASESVLREQDQRQAVSRAVRQLVREHRASARASDRREDLRVDFIQPVKVCAEDGREWTLLSRDLSVTGIRLIGTRRLLGQKVWVLIARPGSSESLTPAGPAWSFLVRVLWTCAVGDDLFENGGTFLKVLAPGEPRTETP